MLPWSRLYRIFHTLKITMKFHAGSLKLSGKLKEISDQATQETILYEGL